MRWALTNRKNDQITAFDSLRKDMDHFFDNFFSIGPSSMGESHWMPKIDMTEDEKAIYVKAEIPGLEEKNLSVSVQNGNLTISGVKSEEKEEKNKRYHLSERRFGSFYRSISLPTGIKADKITARYRNGVLTVEMPRSEEAKEKRIPISVK